LEIGVAAGLALGFVGLGFLALGRLTFARASPPPVLMPYPTSSTPSVAGGAPVSSPSGQVRGVDYAGWTLERVSLRGRDLREADFTGARLRRCDFTGANLEGARFDGAVYDRLTTWPAGFDPREHGALLEKHTP
jgi:hypothetical protein